MTIEHDSTTTPAEDAVRDNSQRNRRRFIAGAGIAGVAALASTTRVSAADNQPMVIGVENGSTSVTSINNSGTSEDRTKQAFHGKITNVGNNSHAVQGTTAGEGHAVAGVVTNATDKAVAATWGDHKGSGAGIGGVSAKGYGGEFVGGKASVRLIPSENVAKGAPTGTDHLVGELFVDGDGNLFYNKADGANFVQLNQPGITMFTDPQRAFDSREEFPIPEGGPKGRFESEKTRTIDLAEYTDLPKTATAVIVNITVDNTGAAEGYITAFNGATDERPTASTLNWDTSNQTIANGVIVPITNGEMNVFAKAETEVIVDVVGYIG